MQNLIFRPTTKEDRILFNRIINDSDFYCYVENNQFVFPEENDVDVLEMNIRDFISDNYPEIEICGYYESEYVD